MSIKTAKNKDIQIGFTLIELLVSMVVIAIIGSVIVSIFFSVLRGTNKTNTLIKVRQSGNYAISQISKVVRSAKSLSSPATCSENGLPLVKEVTVIDQNNQTLTYTCNGDNSLSVRVGAGNATPLMDTNAVSVPYASCNFSCSQGESSNTKVVSVSFTVQQNEDSVNENEAKVSFQTSIALRSSQ